MIEVMVQYGYDRRHCWLNPSQVCFITEWEPNRTHVQMTNESLIVTDWLAEDLVRAVKDYLAER